MISISLEGQEVKVPTTLIPRGRPNPSKIAQCKEQDGTTITIWAKAVQVKHKQDEQHSKQNRKGKGDSV